MVELKGNEETTSEMQSLGRFTFFLGIVHILLFQFDLAAQPQSSNGIQEDEAHGTVHTLREHNLSDHQYCSQEPYYYNQRHSLINDTQIDLMGKICSREHISPAKDFDVTIAFTSDLHGHC